MAEKSFWKRVTGSGLLLPVMSLLLVMAVNIVFDILSGNNPFNFFMITLQQTTSNGSVLYGRIIDVLNRGSEAAILAIGMTLVVSSHRHDAGGFVVSRYRYLGRLRHQSLRQLLLHAPGRIRRLIDK